MRLATSVGTRILFVHVYLFKKTTSGAKPSSWPELELDVMVGY